MKRIVTAIALIMLMGSCRKQEQEPVYGAIKGKLLTQVNVQNGNGFYKLTYDNKKRLTHMETDLEDVYYAYAGEVVTETRQLKGSPEPNSIETLPLKNGRIEEYTYKIPNNGNVINGSGKIEYNADGTIMKETRFQQNDKYETTYIWENQNMVKMLILKNGNIEATLLYEYSDIANPSAIDVFTFHMGTKLFRGKRSSKLRNKITQVYSGQADMTLESTFQFDNEGYISKETSVIKLANNNAATLFINYTY